MSSSIPSSSYSPSSSSPLRVLLIGVGGPGSLACALADGLLQSNYVDRIHLTVLSRPLTGDSTAMKKSAVASLINRGAIIVNGVASAGVASLVPLFRGMDVIVSTIGTKSQFDQRVFIEAAKVAGVKWFIPAQFGFDAPNKGSIIAAYNDSKVDDLAAIKSAGMDWTVIHTGAFSEYATSVVFGVNSSTRTITYPGSGSSSFSQTPLIDVGRIVADCIVHDRSRNDITYTSAATLTFDEYATMIEKVTGQVWTRVIKTQQESEQTIQTNSFSSNPFAHLVAAFQIAIGKNSSDCLASWPVESTYNYKYQIQMHSIEDSIRATIKQ